MTKDKERDDEKEWAETKADYALPDSIVDIGNMYYWANFWHNKYKEAEGKGISYCRLAGELQRELDTSDELHIAVLQCQQEFDRLRKESGMYYAEKGLRICNEALAKHKQRNLNND